MDDLLEWHCLILATLSAVGTIGFVAWRRPPRGRYAVLWSLVAAADGWLTAPGVPTRGLLVLIPVAFVILGDLRFFFLIEDEARAPFPIGRAVALAFVVPIVTHVLTLLVPAFFHDRRVTFLTYELCFLAFASAYAFARKRPRAIFGFELGQYGLWAAADLLILGGLPGGEALRLVPDAMYYALFVPFVLGRAAR